MSVFLLDNSIHFPDPEFANEDGLLAIGGDFKIERLLTAYRTGIFPWFIEDEIPYWFSPDPRFILLPHELHISHSMKQCINKNIFHVTYDTDFPMIIRQCAEAKRGIESQSSWIDLNFQSAYTKLHECGYAHSIEVWREDKIVGGLYGISLGKCFFGESMFSLEKNASKFGFIALVKKLHQQNFIMIDCQVYTSHLESLGAKEIKREIFLKELNHGLKHETIKGNWGDDSIWNQAKN